MTSRAQEEWETWEEICEMFADLSCASEFEHCNEFDEDSAPNSAHPHTEGCFRRDANGIHYLSITPVWTKSSTRRKWRKENEE